MPSDDFWADLPDERRKAVAAAKARTPLPVKTPDEGLVARPARRWVRPLLLSLATTITMAVMAVAGTTLALWQGTRLTVAADSSEPIVVEILRGRSTRAIAADLEDAGIIASRWPFLFEILRRQGNIRAGTYSFSSDASIAEVVTAVTEGDVSVHRVTIPEGWRLEQTAEYLAELGVVSRTEFLAAAAYDPVHHTLPPGITLETGATLEGLLFPDTYEFRIGVTSGEIVTAMLDNFTAKTAELRPTYTAVILASIVEREAKLDGERASIAGVYSNRLRINMKLEADPTVQYGNDSLAAQAGSGAATTWWMPITAADYQAVASLWNTYRVAGLPPTPIAAPGLASLAAAVNPEAHDDYFFFHRPDGTAVFSKTKAEHDQALGRQ